jgi:mannose-6-phosphate isomerase-like protein (cupin superfamily)
MTTESRGNVTQMERLPGGDIARRFEGYEHGAQVSFFLVSNPPGTGPRLHVHPYEETFVIEEGHARFTLGDATIEAGAGEIVIGPAEVPHKFVNAGSTPLRMVNIHPVARMEQEWLE